MAIVGNNLFSLPCFKRRFIFDWRFALISTLVVIFFLRLGFWQLDRAEEKKNIIARDKLFQVEKAQEWQPEQTLPPQGKRIILQGEFLPRTLFLDNQHHQHQFGYDVFTPFLLSNGHIVLVDRGWVPAIKNKMTPPTIAPAQALQAMGSVYYPSTRRILLGPIIEKRKADVIMLEYVDTAVISQFLHKPVYPFIIRLGQEEPNGFVREWPLVSMTPMRHQGYALQWFSLAFLMFTLFLALSYKRHNEKQMF